MINRLRSQESGFTLVEMITTTLIFSIVGAIVAGLIITASLAEKTVRTIVAGTTEGQLAADSIQTGIRNSSAFTLTTPATGDQLVFARIPRGANNVVWNCAAWYYDNADGGTIFYHESEYVIPTPSTADLATWTVLVTGVESSSGSVLSVSGDALILDFEVSAGPDQPPTSIKTSVTSRADVVESAPCF